MKKIKLVCIISIIAVLLSACSKDNIDARDAFVGNYSETITGSKEFTLLGQDLSLPINETGTFSIEKASEDNKVYRVEGAEKILGTINGSQITFSEVNGVSDEDDVGFTLTTTLSGSLSNNTLTCTATITGTGKVIATGATFPVSGSFISTGIKQ